MSVQSIEEYRNMGWGDRAKEFRDFMLACDRDCLARLGMGIYDLPDWDFASAFEDGQSAHDTVSELLEYEGYGCAD